MKIPVYLRVAKTDGRKGYRVTASATPNHEPIWSEAYRNGRTYHPTIAFAVNLNIPDEMFDSAERVVAELNVAMKDAEVSTEIALPKGITVKKSK